MLLAAVATSLAVRRAAGLQLTPMAFYLRGFARFAMERGAEHIVAHPAIAWATTAATEAQRHTRLMRVLRFARFMHAADARHELPPAHLFRGWRQRPTPYIFRPEELQRLVAAARQLGPRGALRPHTSSTLFGLLAATGMRPSDVRALALRDLTPDGLLIRESKCKKSRLLPLHDTTWVALAPHLQQRRRVAGHTPHLCISRRGGKLSHTAVADTFHAVVQAAGIPREPGTPCPTLMDLRHPCAVRRLATGPSSRAQGGRHMLARTTYRGHAKVASTSWYLESTPELMTDIAQRCEAFVAGGGR
jgi:integrase/recombinase XerD